MRCTVETTIDILWVPDGSFTSCDLGIFVYQTAEPVAASEAKVGR
jgi:hypothetical protein